MNDASFRRTPEYHDHVRSGLVGLLPFVRGRYLEIGCGAGGTLVLLKEKGAAYTAGVDIDAGCVAAAAARGVDSVVVADIENTALPYEERTFDCIILADVLEHLRDPWQTLKQVTRYLVDDGCLLVSLPNVKYYKVVRRLIFHDEWRYSDAGILDATHLRFFTLKEIHRLLEFAGFKAVVVKRLFASSARMRRLNALLLGRLDTFFTYQYYVLAKKSR